MRPTQRTMTELRKRGYLCGVVLHRNSYLDTSSDNDQTPLQPLVHTPGPWRVGKTAVSIDGLIEPGSLAVIGSEIQEGARGNIATVCVVSPPRFTTDTDQANARLIAAAPELLSCLQDIMACGVRELDARIGYDEFQIDRATRVEALDLLKRFGLA